MLKKFRNKMATSIDEIEVQRLADRVADFALTPIAEAPLRTRVTIAGEVQSVQVVPHLGSPSLEITVSDGSGRAAAVFTGRRVLLEGVARREGGRLLVVNPAYTIVE